jgi:hypothetical protein
MTEELLIEEPEEVLVEEPEPEPQALAPMPLVQVLPADFPLPALIRFVPDPRFREACQIAAAAALACEVTGAEGLLVADQKLIEARAAIKAAEQHFEEPIGISHQLHSSLCTTRREWTTGAVDAVTTVSGRILVEKQRLERIAAEERRKAQEEENRKLREEIAKRAEEAKKAEAPAAVVENLLEQAKTAQAAPVSSFAASSPPKLAGSSTTENWQPTIKGTARDAEQQPAMADLSNEQRAVVLDAMKAVLEGRAPITVFEINWGYIKKRAKSDKATFAIEGFEAYDAGGLRAKPGRRS